MGLREWIVGLGLFALVGCGGAAAQRPRQPSIPEPPPPVPAAQPQPLNMALRDAARTQIRESLASNDPLVRANAVEAAQLTFGGDAQEVVAKALEDRSSIVRFAGLMAAGKLRLRSLHDKALALANDPSAKVRVSARYALHRMGDTRLSHDLEKTARDPNPRVREDTAFVLGLLEEPSAIKILQSMLSDSDAGVRIQVADSMWRLRDERGLEILVAGTMSNFADDNMLSLLALAGPKDRRVEEHLRGKLTDEYTEIALVAARALGDIGLDDGYGVAMNAIGSSDPRRRLLAAVALGAIGRSDAQNALAPLLQDADPRVRLAAATALLQLRPPNS